MELWLDGSFTTKKPDPEDVDVLVIIQRGDYELIDEGARKYWESIFTEPASTRLRFNCDVHLVCYDETQHLDDYKKLFSEGHGGSHAKKGIFKLIINRHV